MDDLVGAVIGGRYRLDAKLGEGGMGVVYSGFQLDLGRPVAIKLMAHASDEGLARFQREAHAAASLGSPHIVQVFDFQASGADPAFLVMELLNGPSLRELVRSGGPLSLERAARLFVQVLSALDAAHRAGIVHRDIKPANLVITTTPTLGELAKVLDFGIAKLTSPDAPPLTHDGDIIGTMAYMSPEQAAGAHVDARSDLYSTAATLFYALTGALPVAARTAHELHLDIIEGRTRPLASLRPDVDPALAAIVERALAREPVSRFASAQDMADALQNWLAARTAPIPSMRAPGAPEMPSVAPPPRTSGGGIGLVLIGVVILGLVVLAGSAAAAGYYFFVAGGEKDVSPTSASAVSATPVSGTSPGPVGNAQGSTAAAPKGGAGSPVPGIAGAPSALSAPTPPDAVPKTTPDAGPTTTPESVPKKTDTPRSCKAASDCGAGAWSCSDGKCVCGSNKTMCGAKCTNLDFDGNNCGRCGKICPNNEYCSIGRCQPCVPPEQAQCGGLCIQVTTDPYNCGGCGIRCPTGKLCFQGVCK